MTFAEPYEQITESRSFDCVENIQVFTSRSPHRNRPKKATQHSHLAFLVLKNFLKNGLP